MDKVFIFLLRGFGFLTCGLHLTIGFAALNGNRRGKR